MLLRLSQVELPLQHPETSTSSESPTVDNLEQTIYQRVQPAFKTILACVSHHQSLCRELPHSLQEFLRTAANSPRQTKIPLYQPSNLQELEEDYEVEIGNYNPVQPLFYDHGVSIVPLSTKKSNVVDHHILQVTYSNFCSFFVNFTSIKNTFRYYIMGRQQYCGSQKSRRNVLPLCICGLSDHVRAFLGNGLRGAELSLNKVIYSCSNS